MPDTDRAAPWARPPADVLRSLASDEAGLTAQEAARRLASVGPNALPSPPRPHPLLRFARHFDDVLIYILLVSAALKAFLADWVDFTVILVVALANAVVGLVQEGQAERALDGIRTLLSLEATARRDGAWAAVDARDLVPGDVVRLRSGDKVPADVRLVAAAGLEVDESALTGESEPARKGEAAVAPDAGVGDRSSMLFSGTIVTSGRATAVVTATGAATEIGRIQAMIADVDKLETPLRRRLARLGLLLARGILGMAVLMLVVGRVVHGWGASELISAAIGFAVAAVPEGLPALVTITLALGVQQMARRSAITRTLPSVETLGSVTTICSDKTGTLTRNEMTARTVVTPAGRYDVEGLGYEPTGRVTREGRPAALTDHGDLAALVRAVALCNDAHVLADESGRWRTVGQPTEGALRTLAHKAGADVTAERLAAVPFESEHKLAATLDRVAGHGLALHVVGAPDRLLERATAQRGADGGAEPLDVPGWEAEVHALAAQGLRVLAAASRPAERSVGSLTLADVDTGLVLLGIVGIVDPPRPEAVAAVERCHRAGIAVTMITGDHAATAVAIARELGIVPPGGAPVRVLVGAELEAMSQEELADQVRDVAVFARTSPEHKIRIVRALQSHGEVVAMTGDGVNDAPALTRADVGIAMGIKGTEATKEAADIVLADDNFATIERAVEEGRRIYDNIRKSVVFLLPTNGAQSLVILMAVLLGFALPLSAVQILWVNLVTAVTLSLALAHEPAEPGVMSRPPRAPAAPVLSGSLVVFVVWVSLVIGGVTLGVYVLVRDAGDADRASTSALTALVLGQMVFLLSCRFLSGSSLTRRVLRGNRSIWIAIGVLLALQLVFTYAPAMNRWFGSTPIGLDAWGLALGSAAAVFGLTEAGKSALRRSGTSRAVRGRPGE